MALGDRQIAARFLLPDHIVRGADTVIACPLYVDAALVEPSSGTVVVYNAASAEVWSESATITEGIATATVPSSSVPASLPYETGWRVEWSLTVDGAAQLYRNAAHLVRSCLHPVLTDADLYQRQTALDPERDACIHGLQTLQPYRDAAWVYICGKLAQKGSLPHLVVDPLALREPHLCLSLALVYEDFSTRLNEAYADKAATYWERFRAEWADLVLQYDTDGDGDVDQPKRPAQGSVWLSRRA